MEVYVTNYGVTVTSVLLPDNEQGKVNVVWSSISLKDISRLN